MRINPLIIIRVFKTGVNVKVNNEYIIIHIITKFYVTKTLLLVLQ